MNTHQVIIYTTPTCAYCRMAKEYFKKNGIQYTEYNVLDDMAKRQEMLEKSNQLGVPVITVDDQVVIGFDRPRLEQLLLSSKS